MNESMNMFRDHVDPEKEEHRKQIINETDAKVDRIIKLVKSVNSGNRETKQRKRVEVVNLIEDFYKQYKSMCALYEDLREGVKKKCSNEEDKESNASSNSIGMESAGYYSPGSGSKTPNNVVDQLKVTTTAAEEEEEEEDSQSLISENSCDSLQGLVADHLGKKYPNLETKSPGKMKVLEERVMALKLEIEALSSPKSKHERFVEDSGFQLQGNDLNKLDESDTFLNDKTEEPMDRLQNLEMEVDSLTEKLKQKVTNEDLVEERNSLKQQVKGLEVKIESISNENHLSKEDENRIQVTPPESRTEPVKDISNKMKCLQQKFESLEVAPAPEQRDMQILVNKANPDAKSGLETTVKKMGEMVDEFRKKSEDSVRILNRRICVAEQLHNETRDWYKNMRDQQEQDKKDRELAFHSIKIMVSMVSETLSVSETFGLRFAECCEDFTNRVSKVSCEINFVKDWVRRKNDDLVRVKEDMDALVVRLDEKEEEILCSRQKALKQEGKLRDLKKIVKENNEAMISLKEEKREAIRQLCVWIDHQRSRSDFFKKAFAELVARCQRLD